MFSDNHLAPRDQAIITSVQLFKQLTGSQIERLFFQDGSDKARTGKRNRVLRRLVKWRALDRIEERAIGGWKSGSHGFVYTPPNAEAQLRDTHTLNIAELYIRLIESGFEAEYTPEPQLPGMRANPDADVKLKMNGKTFHFYAEVEHARKSDERVASKLRAYERAADDSERFPLVLYLATTPVRLNAIQRVIDKSKASDIFRVVLFEDAVKFLTNGGQSA